MTALRAVFDEASRQKRFQDLSKGLAALGRKLKSELPNEKAQLEFLTSLPSDTFSTMNTLTVSAAAGCETWPKMLLAHPSQMVRFKATSMLTSSDAEEAFLSAESNKQMKAWIIRRCRHLPCNIAVVEHAQRCFAADLVWLVLARSTDEKFFREWVMVKLKGSGLWPNHGGRLPGMNFLATRFPDTCIELISPSFFEPVMELVAAISLLTWT